VVGLLHFYHALYQQLALTLVGDGLKYGDRSTCIFVGRAGGYLVTIYAVDFDGFFSSYGDFVA
jgi:hypothetical protein